LAHGRWWRVSETSLGGCLQS